LVASSAVTHGFCVPAKASAGQPPPQAQPSQIASEPQKFSKEDCRHPTANPPGREAKREPSYLENGYTIFNVYPEVRHEIRKMGKQSCRSHSCRVGKKLKISSDEEIANQSDRRKLGFEVDA
jgi:hypothetical protein